MWYKRPQVSISPPCGAFIYVVSGKTSYEITWNLKALRFRVEVFNTLRLRQNGYNFADDIFKFVFLDEDCCILIQITLFKFVSES